MAAIFFVVLFPRDQVQTLYIIINNFSPKAKWLSVKDEDEVQVNIFIIVTEPEANNCFSLTYRPL